MLTKIWCTHTNQPQPLETILETARAGKFHIPYPIVKAIIHNILERNKIAQPNSISVTDVIGCPRAKYLKETEDYWEEIENLFPAFRGQLLHQILATFSETEAIVETRTSRDFCGYTLTGTADSILTTRDSGKFIIRDYKSTKKIPVWSPWPNHVQQLCLYRWLYEIPVKDVSLSVVYFDLNGGEIAERKIKESNIWSDSKVEEFLTERFLPIAKALETKTIPLFRNVPADVLSWQCAWCPVFDSCFEKALDEPGASPIMLQTARNINGQKKDKPKNPDVSK